MAWSSGQHRRLPLQGSEVRISPSPNLLLSILLFLHAESRKKCCETHSVMLIRSNDHSSFWFQWYLNSYYSMIFVRCYYLVSKNGLFPFPLCTPHQRLVWQAGIFFFIFTFIEKLYPHMCFTMPASLQALGWRIAIRAKVDQKGRVIFLYQVTKSKSKSPDSHIKREYKFIASLGANSFKLLWQLGDKKGIYLDYPLW